MTPGRVEFSASYDRATKILSAVVIAFLAVICLVVHNVVAVCVAALVIVLAYAYSPRAYRVADTEIVVKRLAGNAAIPLQGLREARRATGGDLSGAIRLWGNGGLFGYYGLFRTARLGNCRWYVTNRENAVVVVTEARTALFSPDDVDGFLAAIRAAVPIAPQQFDAENEAAPRLGAFRSPAAWIGIGIAAVTLGVVALAFTYSPGPPSYILTPRALTIQDRFYPVTIESAAVDVAHIRIIDLKTDTGWRPIARTNGFANAHYHSGWFRVANGQKVRLYRADGIRMVLLPPRGAGAPVLLQVTAPEKLVADLRREWE